VSPRRVRLPGKEALFGTPTGLQPTGEEAPSQPVDMSTVREVNMLAGQPATRSTVKHVQVCVWLDPKVAHAIEQVKAQLLVKHEIKVTKSELVELALRHVLSNEELLLSLLGANLAISS
jgi:hypothetical protein